MGKGELRSYGEQNDAQGANHAIGAQGNGTQADTPSTHPTVKKLQPIDTNFGTPEGAEALGGSANVARLSCHTEELASNATSLPGLQQRQEYGAPMSSATPTHLPCDSCVLTFLA